MENGFLHSLNTIMSGDGHGSAKLAAFRTAGRVQNATKLLDATEQLLKISRKANRAISEEHNGHSNLAAYQEARQADQERVKEILAAGKRLFESDLDAIEQQHKAKQATGGSDDVAAQAAALFGSGQKNAGSSTDVDKTLRYLQKGVKNMTRGMES